MFVRSEALQLQRPGDPRGSGRATALPAPDAERALETLSTFGYEVVVLAMGASDVDVAPRDWLLTGDADDCRWARRAGARTILVGSDNTEHAGQPDRCDLAVGSVYGAAIEVVIGEPARD